MCNLSQGIVEDTEREVMERVIHKLHEHVGIEQIATYLELTKEEVENVLEKNQLLN